MEYNKQRTLQLYQQRKKEEEQAKQQANFLRGNINSQIREVKDCFSKLDQRILDFYNIQLIEDLESATVDELTALLTKFVEVEMALGLPIQQYLETGDSKYLDRLPNLDSSADALRSTPVSQELQEPELGKDSFSLLRGD